MDNEQQRLDDLHERHQQQQLTDAEVAEFYELQLARTPRSRAYGRVVTAMYTYVPYLESRPQLIAPFVAAIYTGSSNTFAGVTGKDSFFEFLESKAQVDDKLRAALEKHRPLFETAFDNLQPQT